MSISKEEYLSHYERLGKDLYRRPRVATPNGNGTMVILDLDQDSGYGVGVRMDLGYHLHWFPADQVEVLLDGEN